MTALRSDATAQRTRPAADTHRAQADPSPTLAPRLLDVNATAAYLSVSTWTIRDWVAAGLLAAVELPPLRAREGNRRKARLRRLLFDRAALDEFVNGLRGAQAVGET